MSNKNTNPGGGKTAVPADINNAQPAYFPKPHHTWEGQRPRCPHVRIRGNEDGGQPLLRLRLTTSTLNFNTSPRLTGWHPSAATRVGKI